MDEYALVVGYLPAIKFKNDKQIGFGLFHYLVNIKNYTMEWYGLREEVVFKTKSWKTEIEMDGTKIKQDI